MKLEKKVKKKLEDLGIFLLSGFLIGIATYNFASAFSFPMVGFTGIGLIGYHLFGIPIGMTVVCLNIPMALISWKILGREIFGKSILCIASVAFFTDYIAPLFPRYTGETLLAVLCTATLSGIGYALMYTRNASSGGTDFMIMLVRKKFPHLSLGSLTLILDSSVIILGVCLVSKSADSLLLGILITFLISVVIDKVMNGFSAGKMTMIISHYPEQIAQMIAQKVGRGATFLWAEGSYTHNHKKIVLCACNNKELYIIRKNVLLIDPEAFVVIMDSNEVLGEGFIEPGVVN